MEMEHSFTVPVPKDRAWDVLLDVERVAPCMPGATLDSVDGDEIHGRIKVKVGPINMTYAGTARFVERDKEHGVVTLEASGKETRGAGTASASVRSVLEDRGGETYVKVLTSLNVTGRPAQFGRGVMNEVGGRLLGIFASNLATTLAEEEGAAANGQHANSAAGQQSDSAGAAQAEPAGSGQQSDTAVAAPAAGTSIDELKLPARAASSLRREGISTLGQLATKSEDELLAIDGIGRASVEEIKAKLTDSGLAPGQPLPAAAVAPPPTAATQATEGATPPAAAAAEAAESAHAAPAGPASAAPAPETTAAAARSVAAVPHHSATREVAQQIEHEALNLLKVAGLPVLKRALPVMAGVVAALLIGLRRKARRRHR